MKPRRSVLIAWSSRNRARMLSTDGGPSVRSVHSQKKRMLWYEAEAGIFVHTVR